MSRAGSCDGGSVCGSNDQRQARSGQAGREAELPGRRGVGGEAVEPAE